MNGINIQSVVSDLRARVQSARPNILGRLTQKGGPLGGVRGKAQDLLSKRPKLIEGLPRPAQAMVGSGVGLTTTRFESSAAGGGFRATPSAAPTPTDQGSGYRSVT